MSTEMPAPRREASYTALVRTFNSGATLGSTIASVLAQTVPPQRIVIIDSGSTDGTLDSLPAEADVHHYVGDDFNYSSALNQGVSRVATEFLLIISSHTSLWHPNAIRYALDMLTRDERLGAAYYVSGRGLEALSVEYIDSASFDGFNGVFNTCALVRTSLLRERPFRPEVFSAEDQEWTAWFLSATPEGRVARIRGGGVRYDNPRRLSKRKQLNEYVAIAFFIRRDLLRWRHIALLACSPLVPQASRRHGRLFGMSLALRLALCKVVTPTYSSRYF